jgi:hypothetical protein
VFDPVFGRYGVPLFAVALGIGCFGAAVEIALNGGYVFSQGFGWAWGRTSAGPMPRVSRPFLS